MKLTNEQSNMGFLIRIIGDLGLDQFDDVVFFISKISDKQQ